MLNHTENLNNAVKFQISTETPVKNPELQV
jgi:hypothetical protein